MNINMHSNSDLLFATGLRTTSVLISGALQGSRLPTPAFCALAIIQALASTSAFITVKWTERRLKLIEESKIDSSAVVVANYIIGQVISIAMICLTLNNLSRIGFPLLYDMNSPSLPTSDLRNVFCLVGQSTLVTLFFNALKDLYEARA